MPPYIAPEQNAIIGIWGKPTSTLDWCEENYAITYYVAEFWNTVSNVSMIIPGLFGVWCCFKYGLELRYLMCYLALLLVGIGSLLFHGTLWYGMQLLDELPMLILSSFILYALFYLVAVEKNWGVILLHGYLGMGGLGALLSIVLLYEMGQMQGVKTVQTYITAAILVIYPTVASLVYIFINDPTFHEVAYGLMVLAITVQSVYCVKKYSSWKFLYFGITSFVIYILGFILWNIDNRLCPHLRDYRKHSSAPLDTVTQFHAWWHLFAGFGTYLQAILSSRVRMEYLKYPCTLKFMWGLPYLEVGRKKL